MDTPRPPSPLHNAAFAAPYGAPKPPDEAAAALLELAAAAKVWNRSRVKGHTRLKRAVKAWIELGG